MKKLLFILAVILLATALFVGGCAKPVNLVPPPTGNEVLMKAFEESAGQTVDLVVDQEVPKVTKEMFDWWMVGGNIAPYYRLWWPEMHYDVQFVTPPGGGQMNVIIKEMIWPYYTEFRCILIPGGIGFLSPDGTKIGQLVHTPTPSGNGIHLNSVFTFPAKTPQAYIDAMRVHCRGEMQDFPRFLPELYNLVNAKAQLPANLVPPPTGADLLNKAFQESGGQTVDLVVDQDIRDVTVDMFNWWMVKGNIQPYYRLWWPEMHYDATFVKHGDKMGVVIKEMIGPYYTEFDCNIITQGIAFLNPDGQQIGQLIHIPTAKGNGIQLHSTFTFPAKTPQSFIDAMRVHCRGEMQDFTRFLPQLYKLKAG